MSKQLMKGNDAVVCGALLAGCRGFFGYPITPASEIAHTAALLFPQAGRIFIQAESEVAAINMVYGASSAGVRSMTASSGPGISLKMEGISYLAASELPSVIVDISRVGPGLGNIYPSQGDYNQVVKGGGHGSYRCIVLSPNSVQEMCDFTMLAFELADRYRIPVFVLSDAYVGQMMEPLDMPAAIDPPGPPDWALTPEAATNGNVITSIFLNPEEMEAHVLHLQENYAGIQRQETRCETYRCEDADLILVGFGIVSRILRSAVDQAREQGLKVGLFRPQTLWPFPETQLLEHVGRVHDFLVVELNNGQLVQDIKLFVAGRSPIHFMNRVGGFVPSPEEVVEKARQILGKDAAAPVREKSSEVSVPK
ncbi:3-methyl-2-oxobutanoate dehydrogenase subunit VorB [bacterium]|nr:3-methyl-2-oxobutanoate dehydrogenase subunit VorB [bacterium]